MGRDVGAGPDKIVVFVLDGAGWHVAKDLQVPDGIRLEFLRPIPRNSSRPSMSGP
jgi:hypothetical protein